MGSKRVKLTEYIRRGIIQNEKKRLKNHYLSLILPTFDFENSDPRATSWVGFKKDDGGIRHYIDPRLKLEYAGGTKYNEYLCVPGILR